VAAEDNGADFTNWAGANKFIQYRQKQKSTFYFQYNQGRDHDK
jgi:hypothetical protein